MSENGMVPVRSEASSASHALPPQANEKFFSDIGYGDWVKITHLISLPLPPETIQSKQLESAESLFSFPPKSFQHKNHVK